ncbi:hypothetical protein [Micromonospora sp. CPCC 205739]|uniref:hypothetical protein n=1 Tax=Micromonospora sp. CPCC 205739 TaxID=3122404 RepID=UPI002FF03987
MTTAPALPELPDLRAFMRHAGWIEFPPGPAGSFWSKNNFRIGVPHDDEDPDIISGVVQRIAAVEQIPLKQMAEQIRYFRFDVTHLRAANDYKITSTIPLEAAATITSAARIMLRTVGTTSQRERGEIAGNYSRRGDKVVEEARMGHTREGSFIIPILIRLPEIDETAMAQAVLPGIERSAPEPLERRVMRTFAQSMEAVRTFVVEPAREPTVASLLDVVERGVSREFCVALSRILSEDSVGEFETKFAWAEAVQHSHVLPTSVKIEAEARDLVHKAAEKLRANRIEPRQVFSGKIVELRHEQGNAYGWIKVSTLRHGRWCEIGVRLPLDHYTQAVSWHRDARPVLVEGQVRSAFGRPLIVNDPVRCHPLDETRLL